MKKLVHYILIAIMFNWNMAVFAEDSEGKLLKRQRPTYKRSVGTIKHESDPNQLKD